MEIKSNKTLVGADKNATIKGGINMSDNTSNVVIRNLNILGAGTSSNSGEPADTIAARGSHNLWFDHLNVMDGPDGMLDLTRGSDHATISWSKFSYSTSNRDVTNPHQFADGNHAYITATANVYDNTTGKRETGLGGTDGDSVGPWTPSYTYKLDKAEDVPSLVQRCAGPQ